MFVSFKSVCSQTNLIMSIKTNAKICLNSKQSSLGRQYFVGNINCQKLEHNKFAGFKSLSIKSRYPIFSGLFILSVSHTMTSYRLSIIEKLAVQIPNFG